MGARGAISTPTTPHCRTSRHTVNLYHSHTSPHYTQRQSSHSCHTHPHSIVFSFSTPYRPATSLSPFTTAAMSSSLNEPFNRGVDIDDTSDYHGLSNGRAGKQSSGTTSANLVDALWGSTARKIITVVTALIITILLTSVIYTATHEKEEVIPVPVYPSSTGGGSPTPPSDNTGTPYIPAETEMLRRLAQELDMSRNLSADPCEDWYDYNTQHYTARRR